MRYDFKCEDCNATWEAELSIPEFQGAKQAGIACLHCEGGRAYNVFNPAGIQVSYKGFQWADKNYREKAARKHRSVQMAARQNAAHRKPALAPNFNGERTQTWKEARDAARDAGKVHETYDHLVAAEENAVKKL